LLAIAVTLASWAGLDPIGLAMEGDLLHDAPWRPFTSALLHVGALHLVFNVYWLLGIGVHVEREVGSVRAFVGYAIVAAASALAEQAIFRGGVGLSGVGYGVFAYGWARGRTDARWAAVVDPGTTRTFVIWFFFCIATTVSGVLGVANVAHGVGALVGGLMGLGHTKRWAIAAWLGVVVLAIGLDLRPVRDLVNLAGMPAYEAERDAEARLNAGDVNGSVEALARAVALGPGEWRARYNYGVSLWRAGRADEACDAFAQAVEIDPGADASRRALDDCAP
jgi:membrane associated rhomboid family serine protease